MRFGHDLQPNAAFLATYHSLIVEPERLSYMTLT